MLYSLLSHKTNILPPVYVRNGGCFLLLYVVKERSEDPPGLMQLITGGKKIHEKTTKSPDAQVEKKLCESCLYSDDGHLIKNLDNKLYTSRHGRLKQ